MFSVFSIAADFTFVSPAISVGSVLGLPGIIGATILGAFFEIILSYFIKPLMKLFPPIVTGTVVCLIGRYFNSSFNGLGSRWSRI